MTSRGESFFNITLMIYISEDSAYLTIFNNKSKYIGIVAKNLVAKLNHQLRSQDFMLTQLSNYASCMKH